MMILRTRLIVVSRVGWKLSELRGRSVFSRLFTCLCRGHMAEEVLGFRGLMDECILFLAALVAAL